jgi:hypothetical protein
MKYKSNAELIEMFNGQVGNQGWCSSKATYLLKIHQEFDRRGFDYSIIGGKGGISFAHKIELVGKTIYIKE